MSPEIEFHPEEILKEINHLAREHPKEYKMACDFQNYDVGERTFLGYDGLNWQQCQVLRGTVNVLVSRLETEEKEIFNNIMSLFGKLESGALIFQEKGVKNAA